MSTGATREQIEAAAKMAHGQRKPTFWNKDEWDDLTPGNQEYLKSVQRMNASYLVPPGSAIIGPDVLAAIAAVVQRERVDRALIGPSLSDEQLAALEAVLTPELREQVEAWVREQL